MWQRVYSRLLSTAWKKHSTTLLVAPRHRFLPVIAGNVRAFCQKRAPAKGGIVREIGSKAYYPIHPSNVIIEEINLDDKRRRTKLEGNKQ